MTEPTCPTCGHPVRVVSADEGTNSYEPVEAEGEAMTPSTEAGRAALDLFGWFAAEKYVALREGIRAAEAEARQGYVPASLSPEWHAELNYVAAEARAAFAANLAKQVEDLPNVWTANATIAVDAIARSAVLCHISEMGGTNE